MRTLQETTYRVVEEPRSETYTVCVPRQVPREIEVDVCRLVPNTIAVPTTCEDCQSQDHMVWPVLARRFWRCRGC